mmetsp:Transcript_4859/g.12432  ORF Transcript_4859/g.12432 Transcript_4859/m.12432 type:complete len:229 (-) Transcript_4859:1083-1769(-)
MEGLVRLRYPAAHPLGSLILILILVLILIVLIIALALVSGLLRNRIVIVLLVLGGILCPILLGLLQGRKLLVRDTGLLRPTVVPVGQQERNDHDADQNKPGDDGVLLVGKSDQVAELAEVEACSANEAVLVRSQAALVAALLALVQVRAALLDRLGGKLARGVLLGGSEVIADHDRVKLHNVVGQDLDRDRADRADRAHRVGLVKVAGVGDAARLPLALVLGVGNKRG